MKRRQNRSIEQPVTLPLADVRLLLGLAKTVEDRSHNEEEAIARAEARIYLTYGDEASRVSRPGVVQAMEALYGPGWEQ